MVVEGEAEVKAVRMAGVGMAATAPVSLEAEPWAMAKLDREVVARKEAETSEAGAATMAMAVALMVTAVAVTVEANGAAVKTAVE